MTCRFAQDDKFLFVVHTALPPYRLPTTFPHARWPPRGYARPPASLLRARLPRLAFRRPRRPACQHILHPDRALVGSREIDQCHSGAEVVVAEATRVSPRLRGTTTAGLQRFAQPAQESRRRNRATANRVGGGDGSTQEAEGDQAQPRGKGGPSGSQAAPRDDEAAAARSAPG
jgi:hypothetical protein